MHGAVAGRMPYLHVPCLHAILHVTVKFPEVTVNNSDLAPNKSTTYKL